MFNTIFWRGVVRLTSVTCGKCFITAMTIMCLDARIIPAVVAGTADAAAAAFSEDEVIEIPCSSAMLVLSVQLLN